MDGELIESSRLSDYPENLIRESMCQRVSSQAWLKTHSVSHGQGLWGSLRKWGTLGLETVIARNHWFFCSSRDKAESCNPWRGGGLVSPLPGCLPKGLHQGSSFSLCRGEGTTYAQTGLEGSTPAECICKIPPQNKNLFPALGTLPPPPSEPTLKSAGKAFEGPASWPSEGGAAAVCGCSIYYPCHHPGPRGLRHFGGTGAAQEQS